MIGRVGGDEFAVFLYTPTSKDNLEVKLKLFMDHVHKIQTGGNRVTCSIGAVSITEDMAAEDYYLNADRLLYAAKRNGRDKYIIRVPEDAALGQNA